MKSLLEGASSTSTPSSVRKLKKKDKAAMAFKVKLRPTVIFLFIFLVSRLSMQTRMDFSIKMSFQTSPEPSLQGIGTDFSQIWIQMETAK